MNFLQRLARHPIGFWFVFWGELAERASYYGMKNMLALYLISAYHYSDAHAGSLVQYFGSACYFMPLLGGLLADRFLGKYMTIVIFSIPYICGHLILGSLIGEPWLYAALSLLALGAGAVKPNVSTLMGLIYERQGKPKELISEAFSYYYAAINIGAFITSWTLPAVQAHYTALKLSSLGREAAEVYGYQVALMFPTLLMAVALAVFALGKRFYPHEEIVRTPKSAEQKAEERDTLMRISGLFLLISVFWFVYDQQGSTWILFANKHMDLWLRPFNLYILPNQLNAINALLIIVMTPMFNWMWEALRKRRGGVPVPPTQKMMLGFTVVIGCMGMMSAAGYLSARHPVTVWWFVIATVIITMAELCVSVVGLEFAFTQGTARTKSTVTAAFLLTVTLGDYVGGQFVEKLYDTLSNGTFFAVQANIMIVTAVIFHFVARKFEQREEAVSSASIPVTEPHIPEQE